MKNIIISVFVLILIIIGLVVIYKIFVGKENGIENQEEQKELKEEPKVELKIETLQEGIGDGIVNGDIAVVHYIGTFEDGTKFDSSIDRGEPFSFTLGKSQVIEGWEIGILGMKIGEKRKLTIPPELGYGKMGSGPIPPNAILMFEVELIDIE